MGCIEISVVGLRLRVPASFQIVQSMPGDPEGSIPLAAADSGTQGFVLVYPIVAEMAMPFDKPEEVIGGIHGALADDQGLIEVEAGSTAAGSRYIYSIVKTLLNSSGVQYGLTLHLQQSCKAPNATTCVQAFFDEAGITGARDATVFELERKLGHVRLGANGAIGWAEDPYEPSFAKGALMNLSESRSYDSHFPQHPLTELRRFVDFIVANN